MAFKVCPPKKKLRSSAPSPAGSLAAKEIDPKMGTGIARSIDGAEINSISSRRRNDWASLPQGPTILQPMLLRSDRG